MGVDERGRRGTVRQKVACYETETLNGALVIKTFQGFWRKALDWALDNRLEFEFKDLRIKDLLPFPQLGRMHGFRFSQRELLVKALEFNCSGVIKAPTRWGKSTLIKNTLRAYPTTQTIIVLPGADLVHQMFEDVTAAIPDREVKKLGGGSRTKYQSEDITIVSSDSMHKLDVGPIRLALLDEPHSIIADSRVEQLARLHLARKLAFGATPTGRYDGRDFLLEGMVGPMLACRTFTEGVAEGAVCPIKVMMIRWPIGNYPGDRDRAYKDLMYQNDLFGRCIRYLSDVVIPREWQTLFFIKTEDQADFLHDAIGRDVSVAMAKKLKPKEREEMTQRVARNSIKRVLCSDIYVQGVTFHEVMCLVNCGGGGSSTSTIQKPGRLAEIRPGKNCGLMVDFLFVPRSSGPAGAEPAMPSGGAGQMIRESAARLKAYRDIGYDVHVVERNEIESWFLAQNITAPT